MDNQPAPPPYRNPNPNKEHPFEDVLRLLRERSTSPEEWLEDARKQYLEDVQPLLEMLRGLIGVFVTVAVVLTITLGLWSPEGNGCSKPSTLLFLIPFFVALALLTEWGRRRMKQGGKQDGLPENRWLPNGYGTRLLERLIQEEINKVRAHLQKRLKENQPGWKELESQPIDEAPRVFVASINLLKTLEGRPAVSFVDKRRWLDPTKYENPDNLSSVSAARQATLAHRLIKLISHLRELQTNVVFLNLSPDACKSLWPTLEHDIPKEQSRFVQSALATIFDLHFATSKIS